MKQDNDSHFDPMIYDVMRELTTQVSGTYVGWQDLAKTEREAKHWQEEQLRVMQEAREVNPRSRTAIEGKTAELRKILRDLPEHAPPVA